MSTKISVTAFALASGLFLGLTSIANEPMRIPEDESQATIRFLALGDSYTIGESVPATEKWPALLAVQLAEQGIKVAPPKIIAKTGWTTDELLAAIAEDKPQDDFGLVTLLIGVNNQYRGRSVEEYQPEFEKLLQLAIGFAQGDPRRVIVVSIPDYGITPFIAKKPDRDPQQIAEQLDAYNRAAKEIATKHKTHWVDITPISRKRGGKKRMLAEDGLHPSGAMYKLWAKRVLPVARSALQN